MLRFQVGINPHRMGLDVMPVWYQEVDLIGTVGHDVVTWEGEILSTFELAMLWMQTGKLDCEGLWTSVDTDRSKWRFN